MALKHARVGVVIAIVMTVCLSAMAAQQSEKKDHPFRGKVQKIDEKTKTLTVAGENVPGWMSAMTMIYQVDKEDVLKRVKAGDQITAKVYDGDFKTLHDVQVVPPKPAEKK